MRTNVIVVPSTLQGTVVKAAHSMGHFGITRTKEMLRTRYWFPGMNAAVEDEVQKCFACQVVTKKTQPEPVKLMQMPTRPWETVAMDFGGPWPDGHYNLVVIDKYSRYPEVQFTYSTSFKSTSQKLKKIFATYGTPKRIETDNGPPFTSQEFKEFAIKEGFTHHRVTPQHAQANGEAERFMNVLNKTERIAHLESADPKMRIYEMLTAYRSTPHPATGKTPYQLMMNRDIRIKLDHTGESLADEDIQERDLSYKRKAKIYTDEHKTCQGAYTEGRRPCPFETALTGKVTTA